MHKVKRDAITLLSRNIFLMLRFRKNLRIRKDAKRFLAPSLIIQRLWRKALGRKRVHDLKDAKRSAEEKSDVTALRMRYILSGTLGCCPGLLKVGEPSGVNLTPPSFPLRGPVDPYLPLSSSLLFSSLLPLYQDAHGVLQTRFGQETVRC